MAAAQKLLDWSVTDEAMGLYAANFAIVAVPTEEHAPAAVDLAGLAQAAQVGLALEVATARLHAGENRKQDGDQGTDDADDVFYDAARRRVYVSGGEGCVSVYEQVDADHYKLSNTVKTIAGARTSLFVPETSRLYLAVPRGAGREAVVCEYRVQP
mgnify:CR=1 FL=1